MIHIKLGRKKVISVAKVFFKYYVFARAGMVPGVFTLSFWYIFDLWFSLQTLIFFITLKFNEDFFKYKLSLK